MTLVRLGVSFACLGIHCVIDAVPKGRRAVLFFFFYFFSFLSLKTKNLSLSVSWLH